MFSFNELIEKRGSPLIMGILNVTPDSFSDGGETFCEADVISKVKTLCNDGADIIDIGACSTAPKNQIVSEAEELQRLKRFLPIVIEYSSVPVSVDTFRSEVATYAVSLGASIINDESGTFNPQMARVVKDNSCGWIFMHTGGETSNGVSKYNNGVLKSVTHFFANMKRDAIAYGIDECQLCFDCGIGFGKTRDDDITLLSNCSELSMFSPLLVGASRKRVIGELTGEENPMNRVEGSVAVAKIVSEDGASVLRVHDVKETVEIVKR